MNGINQRGILESGLKGTGLTESTKEIDGGECEMLEVLEVGLYAFLEVLSVMYCLHYLYGEKMHIDMASVVYVVSEIIVINIIYIFHLKRAWSFLMFPILVFYCGFKFGFKLRTIIINNFLTIVLISVLQAVIMVLYSKIFNVQKICEIDSIVINAVMFFVVFIGLKKCALQKLSQILQNNDKLIDMAVSVVIVSTTLLLILFKKNRGLDIVYYATLIIGLILIAMVIIDIGRNKIRAKEAEAELRLHKLYESSFRELIDEIRARQHEFDNHINTIYSQHRLYKTYDELVEAQNKYCGEIMEENRYNKILSQGNPVIICFLYSKFSEMEKSGIDVAYQINIGNLECGMPIHKMVELLGNLIKNAMEAVQKRDKYKVAVMMLEENDKIQIEVSNESEMIEEKRIRDFFTKGYSEKGQKRGYGLYNVKKICEEYNVAITCRNEIREDQNWFVFKAVMKKPL